MVDRGPLDEHSIAAGAFAANDAGLAAGHSYPAATKLTQSPWFSNRAAPS